MGCKANPDGMDIDTYSDTKEEILRELSNFRNLAPHIKQIFRIFASVEILNSVVTSTYRELKLVTGGIVMAQHSVKNCIKCCFVVLTKVFPV